MRPHLSQFIGDVAESTITGLRPLLAALGGGLSLALSVTLFLDPLVLVGLNFGFVDRPSSGLLVALYKNFSISILKQYAPIKLFTNNGKTIHRYFPFFQSKIPNKSQEGETFARFGIR